MYVYIHTLIRVHVYIYTQMNDMDGQRHASSVPSLVHPPTTKETYTHEKKPTKVTNMHEKRTTKETYVSNPEQSNRSPLHTQHARKSTAHNRHDPSAGV